jgi:hypothetical protein
VLGDLDDDGAPDVAAVGADATVLLNRTGGPWCDLGFGLTGTHGEPVLTGTGTLAGGTPVSLTLADALENSTTYLVIGAARVDLPFFGGTLVPAFEAPFGFFVVLPTGPTGTLTVGDDFPDGVPSGLEIVFQHWIIDAGAPFGMGASNALEGTTP